MDIPQIANLSTAIEMKREILKLALEKNLPEERIWKELEIYRKTHPESRRKRQPTLIGLILESILSTPKIFTESPIEDLLKYELRTRGIEFETQKKIGKYWVDFFFPQANLIMEVDRKEYRQKDMKRHINLIKRGYTVLRLRGNEVYKDVEGCVMKISEFLTS